MLRQSGGAACVKARDAGGRTPLMIAARHGLPAMIAVLVRLGAAVDAADDRGNTALHYGAAWGHMAALKALAAAGADGAAENNSGSRPEDVAGAGATLVPDAVEAAKPKHPTGPDHAGPFPAVAPVQSNPLAHICTMRYMRHACAHVSCLCPLFSQLDLARVHCFL